QDVDAALRLVERTTLLWLAVIVALAFVNVATHV
ncbi:MAG: cobalamin biosynthesis protein, partial [Paraburkholderia tropica]